MEQVASEQLSDVIFPSTVSSQGSDLVSVSCLVRFPCIIYILYDTVSQSQEERSSLFSTLLNQST